jgi:hypothetical protein
MDFKQLSYNTGWTTVQGFWSGWLAASAVIAAGKVWTVLSHSELTTSQVLGHIGTPSFRRELAVGLAVYTLTTYIFKQLGGQNLVSSEGLADKISPILPTAIGGAFACFIASTVTQTNYKYWQYSMIALSILLIGHEIFNRNIEEI